MSASIYNTVFKHPRLPSGLTVHFWIVSYFCIAAKWYSIF